MAKSGKLKTDIVEENGKEITYIVLDEAIESEVEKGIVPLKEKGDASLKEEVKLLREEMQLLREEIEILKKRL